MSYELGSRVFKLPEDVADMVKLGRQEFMRALYDPTNHQIDPRAPTNPQNHLATFRDGLGLVDLIQVRIAEGECLGNRRQSFGLMVMAVSFYHSWSDYFQKNGYTHETMQLGDNKAQFKKITSGEFLGSVTELIDRSYRDPVMNGRHSVTAPFILNPDEVPKAALIKSELQKLAEFPDAPWFWQPPGKPRRTRQLLPQPRMMV